MQDLITNKYILCFKSHLVCKDKLIKSVFYLCTKLFSIYKDVNC